MGAKQLTRRYMGVSVRWGIVVGISIILFGTTAGAANDTMQTEKLNIQAFLQQQYTLDTELASNVAESKQPTPTTEVVKAPSKSCSEVACLALSYDDGPDSVNTPILLDILRRYDTTATFFVLGARVKGSPEAARRIFEDGHEIGNHSWNHPNLATLSDDEAEQQVNNTQKL